MMKIERLRHFGGGGVSAPPSAESNQLGKEERFEGTLRNDNSVKISKNKIAHPANLFFLYFSHSVVLLNRGNVFQ